MSSLQMCIKGGSRNHKSGWIIRFDYDADVVERLKKLIPHTHREWHEASKTWWVSEDYEQELNNLFSNWYALAKQQISMF